MALSGAELLSGSHGSLYFVLSRYAILCLILYWNRYFRFFPSCSYTIFTLSFGGILDMPRTELSSAVSQDHFVLVLPSPSYNLPRLGPWAPMDQWARATNYWAPHMSFDLDKNKYDALDK